MVQITNLCIFMCVGVHLQTNVGYGNFNKKKEDNSWARTIFTSGPVSVHDSHPRSRFSPYGPGSLVVRNLRIKFLYLEWFLLKRQGAKTGKPAFQNSLSHTSSPVWANKERRFGNVSSNGRVKGNGVCKYQTVDKAVFEKSSLVRKTICQ